MNPTENCGAIVSRRETEVGIDKWASGTLPKIGSGGLPIKTAGRDWQEKIRGYRL